MKPTEMCGMNKVLILWRLMLQILQIKQHESWYQPGIKETVPEDTEVLFNNVSY